MTNYADLKLFMPIFKGLLIKFASELVTLL